ncbi:hypothetical protein NC651_021288 [Populus alba x Populus x berolinensis]|nr:hypothetical protein NC651_021288 [Populus alba x Populus x berolinensis]
MSNSIGGLKRNAYKDGNKEESLYRTQSSTEQISYYSLSPTLNSALLYLFFSYLFHEHFLCLEFLLKSPQ